MSAIRRKMVSCLSARRTASATRPTGRRSRVRPRNGPGGSANAWGSAAGGRTPAGARTDRAGPPTGPAPWWSSPRPILTTRRRTATRRTCGRCARAAICTTTGTTTGRPGWRRGRLPWPPLGRRHCSRWPTAWTRQGPDGGQPLREQLAGQRRALGVPGWFPPPVPAPGRLLEVLAVRLGRQLAARLQGHTVRAEPERQPGARPPAGRVNLGGPPVEAAAGLVVDGVRQVGGGPAAGAPERLGDPPHMLR